MVQPTADVSPSFDRTQGRDELNLAEFPLFHLARRIPSGQRELCFETTTTDRITNRPVRRAMRIVAGKELGLPTVRDADVLFALVLVGKQTNDLETSTVAFGLSQLCDLLGWPQNGKSYSRIEEAVRKWHSLDIYFETWFDRKRGRTRQLKGIHILDEFEINSRPGRGGQGDLPLCSCRFGDDFFANLAEGNIKRLNLDEYFGLSVPAAKQLYRFLDKRFHHSPTQSFELTTLAQEHVGLSKDYPPRKLKQKLAPAIAELVSIGFIEDAAAGERYEKTGHGAYRIHFRKCGPAAPRPLPREDTPLVGELTGRGVTLSVARGLAADPDVSEDRIREKIELLDWLLSETPQKAPKNHGGWLADAIRKDFAPPAGFESRADRALRLERAAEQAAQKKEKAAARKSAEQAAEDEARAAHERRWEAVEIHLAALPPAERETLLDDAIAASQLQSMRRRASDYRAAKNTGEMARGVYRTLVMDHVEPLLKTTP